jgi:hypothetical protein
MTKDLTKDLTMNLISGLNHWTRSKDSIKGLGRTKEPVYITDLDVYTYPRIDADSLMNIISGSIQSRKKGHHNG